MNNPAIIIDALKTWTAGKPRCEGYQLAKLSSTNVRQQNRFFAPSAVKLKVDGVSNIALVLAFLCVTPIALAQETADSNGWDVDAPNSANELSQAPQVDANEQAPELKSVPVEVVDENNELKVAGEQPLNVTNAPRTQLRIVTNAAFENAQPLLDVDPTLRANIDAQFKRLQETKETADAFSENLGEEYLSYGLLLKEAKRYDEASKVLVDAAHISKINNGLNAIEQRPFLAALMDVHLSRGDTEDADKVMKRIIWLEKENPTINDDLSYPLALRLGNHYLDKFLFRPVVGQEAQLNLTMAENYFSFVLNRFGNRPLTEVKPPYAELALASYWRSKLALTAAQQQPQPSRARTRFDVTRAQTRGRTFNQTRVTTTDGRFANRAEFYLKRYFTRAREEGSPQMLVKSILNLGDLNLMLGRSLIATQFYDYAWQEAQNLPAGDPLLKSFEQPVALPDFDYAGDRVPVIRGPQAVLVPLSFDIDEFGRVRNVQPLADDDIHAKYFTKARRSLRRTVYRPVIRNGKLVASNGFNDDVLVEIKDVKPVEAPASSPGQTTPQAASEANATTSSSGDGGQDAEQPRI